MALNETACWRQTILPARPVMWTCKLDPDLGLDPDPDPDPHPDPDPTSDHPSVGRQEIGHCAILEALGTLLTARGAALLASNRAASRRVLYRVARVVQLSASHPQTAVRHACAQLLQTLLTVRELDGATKGTAEGAAEGTAEEMYEEEGEGGRGGGRGGGRRGRVGGHGCHRECGRGSS